MSLPLQRKEQRQRHFCLQLIQDVIWLDPQEDLDPDQAATLAVDKDAPLRGALVVSHGSLRPISFHAVTVGRGFGVPHRKASDIIVQAMAIPGNGGTWRRQRFNKSGSCRIESP